MWQILEHESFDDGFDENAKIQALTSFAKRRRTINVTSTNQLVHPILPSSFSIQSSRTTCPSLCMGPAGICTYVGTE